MSDVNTHTDPIKRWGADGFPDEHGWWVQYADHVAAVEALRSDITKFTAAVLKALDDAWESGYAQALDDAVDVVESAARYAMPTDWLVAVDRGLTIQGIKGLRVGVK